MSKVKIAVVMDGGAEHEVAADQRDWAKLEAAEIGLDKTATRVRHLAWSAAARAGLTSASWADFNDRQCVEATYLGEVDEVPKVGTPEASGVNDSA
jgi:hypothetical protein